MAYMPGDALLELSLNPKKEKLRYWAGERKLLSLDAVRSPVPEVLRLIGVTDEHWAIIWGKLKEYEGMDPCLLSATGDCVRKAITCLLCPIAWPLLVCLYAKQNARLPIMLEEINEVLATYNAHVECGHVDVDGISWSQESQRRARAQPLGRRDSLAHARAQEMVRFCAGDLAAVDAAQEVAREHRQKLSEEDIDLLVRQPSSLVLAKAQSSGVGEASVSSGTRVRFASGGGPAAVAVPVVELEMAPAVAPSEQDRI